MSEYTGLKEFGFNFLGPILHTYLKAVQQLTNKKSYHIYHLAREGYHIKTAYESLYEPQNSSYLYVSRTFLFRIMISDEFSWEYSLSHGFQGTLRELLIFRFGFNAKEAETIVGNEDGELIVKLPEDKNWVQRLFSNRMALLQELTQPSRDSYLEYLREKGLFDTSNTPLFLDLGYSGTIQKLLTHLISRDTEGCYFITTLDGNHDVGENVATMHYVFNSGIKMGEGYVLLDRSMFLESLLTSPQGQFSDIRKIANKTQYFFGKKNYTQENPKKIETIFEGALEAISDFYQDGISFTHQEIEDLFQAYVSKRNLLPIASWQLFEFDDAISGFGTVNSLRFFGL